MCIPSRLLALVVFLLAPLAVCAQIPPVVGYQGYLTDAEGEPLDVADATLTFRLWEEPDPGGTVVWTETQTGLAIAEGVFSVALGSVESLEDVVFDRPLWLGTAVGDAGAEELLPRTPLTTVPYSLNARALDLPLVQEVEISDAPVLSVSNGGSREVAFFSVNNPTSFNPTIRASTNGTGPTLFARTFGTGSAGLFRIDNNGNASPALEAVTASATAGSVALLANHEANVSDGDIAVFQNQGDTEARIDKQGVGHFGRLVAGDELSGAPEPGGVYRDNVVYAWARVNADGTLADGFGCTVIRTGTGRYRVTLARSLPDGMAPVVSPLSANDPIIATVSPSGTNAVNVLITGFVSGVFLPSDRPFFLQVVGRP